MIVEQESVSYTKIVYTVINTTKFAYLCIYYCVMYYIIHSNKYTNFTERMRRN